MNRLNRIFPMGTAEDRIETVGNIVGLTMASVLFTVVYWVAVQI